MNDEYLWQKTGEDPETRRLEDALRVFRYRDDDQPTLPGAVPEAKRSRRQFTIAFAAPAFAALAIATTVWFQTADSNGDSDITFVHHPATDSTPLRPVAPPPLPAEKPAEPQKQSVYRHRVDVQSAALRRPVAKKPVKRNPVLTAEERYAYDQVVLALSISSSSLNVVRDAINGVDHNGPQSKQNNR